MYEFRFTLNVPAKKINELYQDGMRQVIVRSHNGKRIQLPAHELRRFITDSGLVGSFRVVFDENNKLIRLERI